MFNDLLHTGDGKPPASPIAPKPGLGAPSAPPPLPTFGQDLQTATKEPTNSWNPLEQLPRLHSAYRLEQAAAGHPVPGQAAPSVWQTAAFNVAKPQGVLQPWQRGLAQTLSNPRFGGAMLAGPLAPITKAVGGIGGLPVLAGLYGLLQNGQGLNDLKLLLGGGLARKQASPDRIDGHLLSLRRR